MRRKAFAFFYTVCVLLALIFLSAGPLIVSAARKTVSGALINAQVDIKSCRLWPPGSCVISGMEIRRKAAYSIAINTITVRIRPSFILSKALSDVSLEGVKIFLNSPNILIADLPGYVKLQNKKGPGLLPENISVQDFALDVKTRDAIVDAQGSFAFAPRSLEFKHVLLSVRQLAFAGIRVLNASLQAAAQRPGSFSIEKLNAGKLAISDIKSRALLAGRDLILEDMTAEALGGSIKAGGRFTIAADMPYEASIKASDLDLAVFVRDFGFRERLELSGLVNGAFEARGSASGFERLSGGLTGVHPGGFLNIRDQSMIDTLAARSGQASDLISQSFKDYSYDNVSAQLYPRDNKLMLDVTFDGSRGKRSLKVVLHDFTLQGG